MNSAKGGDGQETTPQGTIPLVKGSTLGRKISRQMCWDDDHFRSIVSSEKNVGMTADQLEEYRQMFQLFDKDENGSITTKELQTVLQSLGQDTTEASVQSMFDKIDEDADGVIEFPEFLSAICKITNDVESSEELIEIFRVIDQDGDGFISRSDLRQVCMGIGMSLSNQEMEDMFAVADHDTDDKIEFEEFVSVITARH